MVPFLLWGITRIIGALRGEPEDFEEWKNELKQLQSRLDKLEQSQRATSPNAADAQANWPTGGG